MSTESQIIRLTPVLCIRWVERGLTGGGGGGGQEDTASDELSAVGVGGILHGMRLDHGMNINQN